MITPEQLTRVKHDSNGNSRYICHFLDLLTPQEGAQISNEAQKGILKSYNAAVQRAHKLGGRKYNTKKYGYFYFVFQCPAGVNQLAKDINALLTA